MAALRPAIAAIDCVTEEDDTWLVSSRRAFLGFATSALAAAALGATGVRLIDVAEALPIDPDPRRATTSSELIKTQWGPPPRPGWGPPPRRRRHRRWVCWWHRGRRRCGWRWV
ncbi:twin-arginine translocation signal domain-containing protein [Bradyrhizobium yuanmingense]|uniref:twin-arginine translocation signal domain-containing protein n=1 Tax=Bradyrhizobium yuanmingense TaxID=108015 RepID=UPI003516FB10